MEKDVDRHAASGIPIAGDAQPFRRDGFDEPVADADGAGFVEIAVIAERLKKQFQRLTFHQPFARNIINHDMREIGLACQGTKACEFGAHKAHEVVMLGERARHFLDHRFVGR